MLLFGGLDGVEELPASGAPVVREGRPRLPACAGEEGPGRQCAVRHTSAGARRGDEVVGRARGWPTAGARRGGSLAPADGSVVAARGCCVSWGGRGGS
jgi:hypothetical protein